jgi:hypothetical protein
MFLLFSDRSQLRVTPKGLLVSVVESSGPVDMFFDISTVNLLEAVRFTVVNEKKQKAQFVPLQVNRYINIDNPGKLEHRLILSICLQLHSYPWLTFCSCIYFQGLFSPGA